MLPSSIRADRLWTDGARWRARGRRFALVFAIVFMFVGGTFSRVALAGPDKAEVFLVAGLAGSPLRDRAINVRIGEKVTICTVVRLREGHRWHVFSNAPSLRLFGRGYRRGARGSSKISPLSELGRLRVGWWRVEPQPHHIKTLPPNADNPAYSNARLFGPRHGTWLGYDTIEYHETPIVPGSSDSSKASSVSGASGCLTVSRTHPTHPKVNVNGGLGTMRYKIAVDLLDRDMHLASWGQERTTPHGISPRVLRVTFRGSDDLVGYLQGFFNVPNVFGSGGHGRNHQTEFYQGADCADVIVGAMREAGAKVPYTSARGLARYARPVTPRLLLTKKGVFSEDGKTEVIVRFGHDVRPGDFMLIDYKDFNASPRAWDHVGVVAADEGVSGRFDPADPVLHMGYLFGLTREVSGGEAPAYVRFLRLRPRLLRAIARHATRLRRRDARRRRRLGQR